MYIIYNYRIYTHNYNLIWKHVRITSLIICYTEVTIIDRMVISFLFSLVFLADDKLRSLLVERNDTWIESTAAKVNILLKRLGSLSNHDSWKVRIALIKLAESVLTKCQK